MAKVFDQFGRELVIESVSGESDDIQIESVYYVNDDIEVTDDVIEFISDKYADKLYECWLDNQIMRAESYAEGMER